MSNTIETSAYELQPEDEVSKLNTTFKNVIIWVVIPLICALLIWQFPHLSTLLKGISWSDFLLFAFVGFCAQLIDGAIGMAYGISSTTFLMSVGVSPVMASASVHIAEIFTTGISGISHLKFGNVEKSLFKKLVIPGSIGAVVGAVVLSSIGAAIKPFIALYLLVMGLVILRKALRPNNEYKETRHVSVLALFGGFVDAVGGGGWGPVVASTLIGNGHNPRLTIGSVNAAEFFVAAAGASVFSLMIQFNTWLMIAGLLVGGVFAAPLAAYLCKKIPHKHLMLLVGIVVCILSLRTLFKAFF